ncbi:undecaprenyl-phosphate glucose phosphotransferase [Sphingomonas hankyongi]|uniref:Undecaprenyl-phosphate glucose phosphotransferase n=1 Tax=Sphingomonas hankyongi TaxID=2908209 RepID=A0ABT0S2N5_9SPHN|nr:undecaprenyl-phosphate glucose phosphotransferase [Sphingomonas hankyongi]MCL6730118.1 undecaprenyl-phosphate glucose phosphotransferase [Sphingomonas hankyongi]
MGVAVVAGRVVQGSSAQAKSGFRLHLSLAATSWACRVLELAAVCLASIGTTWFYELRVPADLAANYGRLTLLSGVLYLIISESLGANEVEAQLSLRNALGRVLTSWAVTAGSLLLVGFLLKVTEDFSRIWVVAFLTSGAVALMLTRGAVTPLTRHMKGQGVFNQRVAIYGAGPQGSRLASYILGHEKLTLTINGFYDDRVPSKLETHGLPLLGGSQQLIDDVRRDLVDQVIVALPWSAEKRLREIVEKIALTPVRIRLAPDVAGLVFAQRSVVLLGEVPVVTVFERPISGVDQALKWLEDHVLGMFILLLAAPAMAVIALAIKLDSPGPVFFRQQREGFNSRPFMVWKFRSMYVDRCQGDAIDQAQRNDPRITRVGAFLRKTSLDELPQLFNVLLGHMSLVGPRPHAPSTRAGGRVFSEVIARYAARHNVKPGMTGWAQVCGWRGETHTEEQLQKRFEHDLFYIENWSLWFDLYILMRTAGTVVMRRGAY